MNDNYKAILRKLYGAARLMLDNYYNYWNSKDIDSVKRLDNSILRLETVLDEVNLQLNKQYHGK